VIPIAVPFPDGGGYLPSASGLADLSSLVQADLVALCERVRVPGVEIHLAMAEGPAKQVIPRIARESGFDLVVMGTHGRTGLAHVLLGSVAEAVVRAAPCPVVTVPVSPQTASPSPVT
jgi:nucleotide-binding universal stress UspA family protein